MEIELATVPDWMSWERKEIPQDEYEYEGYGDYGDDGDYNFRYQKDQPVMPESANKPSYTHRDSVSYPFIRKI